MATESLRTNVLVQLIAAYCTSRSDLLALGQTSKYLQYLLLPASPHLQQLWPAHLHWIAVSTPTRMEELLSSNSGKWVRWLDFSAMTRASVEDFVGKSSQNADRVRHWLHRLNQTLIGLKLPAPQMAFARRGCLQTAALNSIFDQFADRETGVMSQSKIGELETTIRSRPLFTPPLTRSRANFHDTWEIRSFPEYGTCQRLIRLYQHQGESEVNASRRAGDFLFSTDPFTNLMRKWLSAPQCTKLQYLSCRLGKSPATRFDSGASEFHALRHLEIRTSTCAIREMGGIIPRSAVNLIVTFNDVCVWDLVKDLAELQRHRFEANFPPIRICINITEASFGTHFSHPEIRELTYVVCSLDTIRIATFRFQLPATNKLSLDNKVAMALYVLNAYALVQAFSGLHGFSAHMCHIHVTYISRKKASARMTVHEWLSKVSACLSFGCRYLHFRKQDNVEEVWAGQSPTTSPEHMIKLQPLAEFWDERLSKIWTNEEDK